MTRPGLVATGAALGLVCLVGWWALQRIESDPGTAFLRDEGGVPWVVYPRPADARAHGLLELAATFRRSFALTDPPPTALLGVRAMRRFSVRLNGAAVPLPEGGRSWKEMRRQDVAHLLRVGVNTLEVAVSNDSGPPALWLELTAGGLRVASDDAWQASLAGASWRSAALASEPPPGRRYDPDALVPAPLDALLARWPALVLYALLGGGATWLLGRRQRVEAAESRRPILVALLASAAIWCALLAMASGVVPIQLGFDAPQHLEYVDHVLRRHALPLADEGWQMFQPPLYYLAAAAALGLAGIDTFSAGAAAVLRALGLAIGVAHLALLAALLRRVLPARPAAQVAGLIVAAALPCALTLHLFPTNEILGAALCTAALLLAVIVVRDEGRQPGRHLLLGLLLGLALLSKVSALLLVLPVVTVLALRAVRGPSTDRAGRISALAASLGAAALAAGWHYGRVWARFGTPLVGGWEARPGLGWWVDPGYRTTRHLLRFGRVLVDPTFAGFGGLWDGLYSTMWGDGMLSGLPATSPLPPWWAPAAHSAGYLLALLPMGLILVGLVVTVRAWVRAPRSEDGLLLGVASLTLLAQVAMSFRVAAVAQDKASYGLLALGPLVVFAARGFDTLAGARRWRRCALAAGLAVWALNGLSTFLVDADGPAARQIRSAALAGGGKADAAEAELRAGLQVAPADGRLRVALARLLMDRDRPPAEVERLLDPSAPGPDLAARHLALAILADHLGDRLGSLQHALRAVALDPDGPGGLELLASLLEEGGHGEQAVAAWQEALRVDPVSAGAHAALARLLAAQGRPGEAALHRAYLTRLGR